MLLAALTKMGHNTPAMLSAQALLAVASEYALAEAQFKHCQDHSV